jgi:hypothetical protein
MILSGCTPRQSGDFGQYITTEIASYGGKVWERPGASALHGTWVTKKDSKGFECVVTGVSFGDVDNVLTNAFRAIGEGGKTDVGMGRLFVARQVGVALTVRTVADGVRINCLKGMTNLGAMFE